MPSTKNSNNKNQDMPQYNSEYENVYLGFVTLSMNLITKQQQQQKRKITKSYWKTLLKSNLCLNSFYSMFLLFTKYKKTFLISRNVLTQFHNQVSILFKQSMINEKNKNKNNNKWNCLEKSFLKNAFNGYDDVYAYR